MGEIPDGDHRDNRSSIEWGVEIPNKPENEGGISGCLDENCPQQKQSWDSSRQAENLVGIQRQPHGTPGGNDEYALIFKCPEEDCNHNVFWCSASQTRVAAMRMLCSDYGKILPEKQEQIK